MRAGTMLGWWMVVAIPAAVAASGEEERLDPELLEREYLVAVVVSGAGGQTKSMVTSELSEGAVRVPVVNGKGVDLVVEVVPVTILRNSATLLKPAVRITVTDARHPGGEGGEAPLVLLSCQRKIDWRKPGTLTILESEGMTLTVSMEPVDLGK